MNKVKRFVWIWLAAVLLSGAGFAQAAGPAGGSVNATADCIFNWAEKTYPDFFSPAAQSGNYEGFYYRLYTATNSALGVYTDGNLYFVGELSEYEVLNLGPANEWAAELGCK